MKVRADQLVQEKEEISRSKAKALIMAGDVYLDQVRILKAGQMLDEQDIERLVIRKQEEYVSRGAYKLLGAISRWELSIEDSIAMDVGASTGGFTQVLLEEGAKKVYSVDVGYGQLAYSLRVDNRVVVLERENIRKLSADKIQDPISFFTMDVSFISVTKVLEHLRTFLTKDAQGVILIKPQFESKRGEGKKGVIKDPKIHTRVLEEMVDFFEKIDMKVCDIYYSPIQGPKGNREYLMFLENSPYIPFDRSIIHEVVTKSHKELS